MNFILIKRNTLVKLISKLESRQVLVVDSVFAFLVTLYLAIGFCVIEACFCDRRTQHTTIATTGVCAITVFIVFAL